MSKKTLYELVEKEGTHLADSHKTEGAKSGDLLDNETNKPCGAGEFIPRVVDIDDEEDNDLIDDDHSDESSDSNALDLSAFGFVIGVVAPPLCEKMAHKHSATKDKKTLAGDHEKGYSAQDSH